MVASVIGGGTGMGTAVVAATGGMIGALPAAALGAALSSAGRARRFLSPAIAGGLTAVAAVQVLLSL